MWALNMNHKVIHAVECSVRFAHKSGVWSVECGVIVSTLCVDGL